MKLLTCDIIHHIASAMLLLAIFSLAILPAASEDGYPKTIVDSANRTITLDKPVERIVVTIAAPVEPIYVLGVQDKLVGVSENVKYDKYPWLEGTADIPDIGDYFEHDYEKIVELNPDVVLTMSQYLDADQVLEDMGIKVVVLGFYGNEANFEQEFRTLAELTDSQERAEEFLSWRKNVLDTLEEGTSNLKTEDKMKVYGGGRNLDWMYHTGSRGTALDRVITLAGGTNIASDLGVLNPEVDPEWILEENPNAVLFSASGTTKLNDITGYYVENDTIARLFLEEDACKRPGIEGTNAVDQNRLYVLDEFCVYNIRNFIGACYMAKWLYPDLFEDLDPEEMHREYFEEWLGTPYQGIWAYPQ